jgi:hypothetical protein
MESTVEVAVVMEAAAGAGARRRTRHERTPSLGPQIGPDLYFSKFDSKFACARSARKFPRNLPVSGTPDQNLREICLTMYQLPLPSYHTALQLCGPVAFRIWKVHATQRHTAHSSPRQKARRVGWRVGYSIL